MKKIIKIQIRRLLILVCVVVFCVALWHVWKPLPEGISVVGDVHTVANSRVSFLRDHTFIDRSGLRTSEQEIFDEVFALIDGAQDFVVIDMFLFNNLLGRATTSYRAVSDELVQRLVDKKEVSPDINIIFITDPINNIYGGDPSAQLGVLQGSGFYVVETDLDKLRDSNPLYSGLWRSVIAWWGNDASGGWLPHVMDARRPKITLRTYLRLLNFKANHRKVIVADSADTTATTIITSANPHDGSAAHSNVALKVMESQTSTGLWRDILTSEQAVADFSGSTVFDELVSAAGRLGVDSDSDFGDVVDEQLITVQLLTEKKIKETLLADIGRAGSGDSIDMLMFYISDRDIVRAVGRAAQRGVQVRLVFDPNKDAFGREKNGVPNRQVAHELVRESDNISIRWCSTTGEQCHSKITIFTFKDGERALHIGSANLTRRNIGNYNLEANVVVRAQDGVATAIADAQGFFDTVWTNEDERISSVDYDMFADDNRFRIILYHLMEATGISSF